MDPYVIVVNKKSPFNTLGDLVEHVKNNLGKLNVARYGAIGSGHNVAWNILVDTAGIEAYTSWKSGEITAVKAMQEIGVKKTTFYKLVREYEESI
ncbi:tripartite tricarboxylate transporter substrate-binding protein [Paenisporosarcina antarctica]|uniref:tripartite tricarboxylate transporter substrate-binding protein n=1 Tax=Paenisporosarcina antarctica TaxID=417367 RepID=UPI002ADD4C9F|nr:tripartite tricarboxylate transporter substrate-binding protein [Paenisporosarcina antarctica]